MSCGILDIGASFLDKTKRDSKSHFIPSFYQKGRSFSYSIAASVHISDGKSRAKTITYRLAAERRGHLEWQIRKDQLDLTHETITTGRPYSLVLTKTEDSYHRALKRYDRDCEHLKTIVAILEQQSKLKK